MFSSSIIPTIGRSSLSNAVQSVLDQAFQVEDFEVIVVNDSGKPLPEMDWQFNRRVKMINTQRRERGVARNTGAAIAKGRYLHFLDDDDLMLPGAMQAFWELSQATDAVWLHGHYQSMDNDGNILREFDPEMEGNILPNLIAGEAIPLQASLLNSWAFFRTGAFDPNIPGVEDHDIERRLARLGKTAGTNCIVARIRVGQVGSTTDWSKTAERDRWSREKVLSEPGAYENLAALDLDNYWRGRMSRAFIASMAWNMKRKNVLIATSRAAAALHMAGFHTFSSDFWSGLKMRRK